MLIFPAIDIKDGKCVRLYQGDMNTAETVAADAFETALAFKKAGALWVHMVDLNGAVSGKRVNSDIFLKVAADSGLKLQLGGGIRTMADVEFYLERGVDRIIFGSAAITNPALVKESVKLFGEKIAVGIDAKDGKAATEGWVKDSGLNYIDLAKKMEGLGVGCIIYTDIGRDGMLKGPNLEQLDKINRSVSCDIIASGGVTDLDDIKQLKELGLYGAICGRSIYSGSLKLEEAVAFAQVTE
ncbi:MAG TPA: 1-(5-phosphoribosyl)-5-[(5-phosphoribosylamino)methylideneamino]imidazole-4-carboxamide isomerase [Clostridiales bacterium]|jgi:phosphoribosylformimino-5-aminoimidazole carboxamide ribotide isomerase|nr:1-(5-phosphoribosyl)-5-[(5-phosphoribosylamino)methylideneamino]imidazole-4-carboxamide isomerase [Clostridiales bacterium]